MDYLRERALAVPVAGVRARDVRGSFDASRGDHLHEAVDILAARGTPVLSADDGRVWKIRSNALGGLTVYAVDPGERFVYYYAHLDGYRRGLTEGQALARGDTLGYVGTTGNAPPDVPHLHFQVSRIGPDRKWWTGTPVDPTPVLHDAADLDGAERRRADERGKGVKVRKDGGR
jgi:murein DD-endopeptidase MepM/ murein hydrolase activator NlpD